MKMIHAAVIEPDFYARSVIALLLARDWRTRVVFEAPTLTPLSAHLSAQSHHQRGVAPLRLDALLINPHQAGDAPLAAARKTLAEVHAQPTLLALCDELPGEAQLARLAANGFSGCLLKDEIGFSLSWALVLAAQGRWVTTPGVVTGLVKALGHYPEHCSVLDGVNRAIELTNEQELLARLAVIFSLERRDLADEQGISVNWGYGKVAELYERLYINQLINGELPLSEVVDSGPAVSESLNGILAAARTRKGKKAHGLEMVAFHLLSLPGIKNIN